MFVCTRTELACVRVCAYMCTGLVNAVRTVCIRLYGFGECRADACVRSRGACMGVRVCAYMRFYRFGECRAVVRVRSHGA